jgi:hypothetical protein
MDEGGGSLRDDGGDDLGCFLPICAWYTEQGGHRWTPLHVVCACVCVLRFCLVPVLCLGKLYVD